MSLDPKQIEVIMLGLRVLLVCAQQPGQWKSQLDKVLQLESTHICLMKSVLSKDYERIQTALELLQVDSVPIAAVTQTFVKRNDTDFRNTKTEKPLGNDGCTMRIGISSTINPFLQDRIEDAIDKILNSRNIQEVGEQLSLN